MGSGALIRMKSFLLKDPESISGRENQERRVINSSNQGPEKDPGPRGGSRARMRIQGPEEDPAPRGGYRTQRRIQGP